MIYKIKKRKILIPRGVKLRKCYVHLGKIDNLLQGSNTMKRKPISKPVRGAPPPPGTKLIRVKSDLFKKKISPVLLANHGNMERSSKRTPKPNRRYLNDEVVTPASWNEKDISAGEHSDKEDRTYKQRSSQMESIRKLRANFATPKSVFGMAKKSEMEKVLLTKRKIVYEYDYEEEYEEKQSKQSKKDDSDSDENRVDDDSDSFSDGSMLIPMPARKPNIVVRPTQQKSIMNSPKPASRQVNSRSRPLIKLPPTSRQKIVPAKTPQMKASAGKTPPVKALIKATTTKISPNSNTSNKLTKSKDVSPISKPNVVVDLEDFEQMPTFTIVNINDIINQKEEVVVVIEKSPSLPGNKVKKIATKKTEKPDATDVDELVTDLIDEDDDDLVHVDKKSKNESKTPSRRKTPHKVLSDQVIQPTATKETKTTVNKSSVVASKPYRNIIGGKNNGKLKEVITPPKPPPRILNSQLCTNADTDISTVVAKITSPKKTVNNNIKPTLNRSKENIKQDKPNAVTHITTISGGRKVRKITCFETWFVIKLPQIEPIVSKSVFDMELMTLGNDIRDIPLPTSEWNYKITLCRITKPNPNGLIYCGEVQDSNIKEEEKHFYQPSTIMFRRECKNKALRMQFDRAVIMKNRNFFINIDGKNVKLIGAPQFVQNFEDIETLLQIVDNIELSDPLVEQTTYVI